GAWVFENMEKCEIQGASGASPPSRPLIDFMTPAWVFLPDRVRTLSCSSSSRIAAACFRLASLASGLSSPVPPQPAIATTRNSEATDRKVHAHFGMLGAKRMV